MKKSKLLIFGNIIVGLVLLVILIDIFGDSFASSTTFKDLVENHIKEDKQLNLSGLDTERISSIRIEPPPSEENEAIEIRNKDSIYYLLTNELPLDKKGKFETDTTAYELYIHFYGASHRYSIGEDYLSANSGFYEVTDKNEIFEYLRSLFEQEKS